MLIRFEYNGRILHETTVADITGEITIGRSTACAWQIPREDQLASSQHVKLCKKGKQLWLHDLGSTNGTFYQGKRIMKKRLVVGDKIGIGNSLLLVEAKKSGDEKIPSALLVRSGQERGKRKPLLPPRFTIGSDPSSNLVFLDMLVSRSHAEISVKEDGSCWIRDLESKNGTTVNGLPLREKERLLKDGDRIAFSHFEVEFQDGTIARSNKQVWLRILILAVTLGLGVGAYHFWQGVRPSAQAFIAEARHYAAQEDFDTAREVLEKAAVARQAASNQVAIENLRQQLGEWQQTLILWQRAQKGLQEERWTPVSRDLGTLQAFSKHAWEWNTRAPAEKEHMSLAKLLLDATLRGQALCGREDITLPELEGGLTTLHKGVEAVPADLPEYLQPLLKAATTVTRQLETIVSESTTLEQALDLLTKFPPAYDRIMTAVNCAATNREPSIARRATMLTPALQAMITAAAQYQGVRQQLLNLELSHTLTHNMQLPATDLCALDPRISEARQHLDHAMQQLRQQGTRLQVLLQEVEKHGGTLGSMPSCLRSLQDQAQLEAALTCDSLNLPLPKRSRTEPSGSFDALLCVEEFYTRISTYPDQVDPALVADLPLNSAVTHLRELCLKIENLLRFLNQPEQSWLKDKAVQKRATELEKILQQRDQLVAELVKRAEAGSERVNLIAGGIVSRLVVAGDKVLIKGEPPQNWVASELKRQRAELIKINNEYSLAEPARQIAIRNQILAQGIPGDPIVRRMWAFRDAAQAVN